MAGRRHWNAVKIKSIPGSTLIMTWFCNMHAILEIWRLSYSFGHWVIGKQQKRPSLVIQSWLLDHWPKHLLQRWPAPSKSLWSLFQPELVQRIKSSLIDQCILFNADLLPQKILFQPVQRVKSCVQLHRRAALTPADGIDIFLKLLQVKRWWRLQIRSCGLT